MDLDVSVETGEKRLNQWVGMAVLAFSVILGIAKIKDDNIVQAMQLSKMQAVDTWNQYQATKLKLHLLANSDLLLSALLPGAKASAAHAQLAGESAHYQAELPQLKASAESQDAGYNKLNYRDDQFDLADAMLSIAMALAGITALTRLRWMLMVSVAFGAVGTLFVLAGFNGWQLHPDWIVNLLS
ncbi:DUF4337 domain-containing protein [Silvimonas iriomotensis]|uniref:DUF4337 domain-containing protein n=1 Tax=Silvimonas iriomotensis TaxID=449662 RepID=A0ABQ2PF18_9NEIS|nr:DUF4337 domain-containing protein [Silvimonas iriomotensis]GGP24162.1 hypothetical protein GCM10010970_41620 [Silvimonas iriomotensis]